ncbi:MAG: hypothetical protein JWP58_2126 [Hymenobacter sp.]|nr:hypothetical protein [Hymenobacter sp.]
MELLQATHCGIYGTLREASQVNDARYGRKQAKWAEKIAKAGGCSCGR